MSKKVKRANGEGLIRQRSDGRWESRATIGTDLETGLPVVKSFYGKTKVEALSKMNLALVRRQQGIEVNQKSIRFETWLNIYLSDLKTNLRPSTWKLYEMLIRVHIVPVIGNMYLDKLTSRKLQDLYNAKFENGRTDGTGGLAPRTVELIHIVIHSALKKAVDEGYIYRNVSNNTKRPKNEKKEIAVMSLEDQKMFLHSIKGDRLETAFVLALASGMRRGELLGLKWQDIDLSDGVIRVHRSLSRIRSTEDSSKTILNFQPLKTEKSKRSIPIPNSVLRLLKSHKASQNMEKLALGSDYLDIGLVFCTENGNPIEPRNFNRKFQQLI